MADHHQVSNWFHRLKSSLLLNLTPDLLSLGMLVGQERKRKAQVLFSSGVTVYSWLILFPCLILSGGCTSSRGLVSSQHRFETMDRCYSLVTVQDFVKQTAVSTPSRGEGGRPQRSGINPSRFPCFQTFDLLTLEPALCKIGLTATASPEGCMFFPREVSHSGPGIFPLSSFSQGFPFLCLPLSCCFLTIILDSFF